MVLGLIQVQRRQELSITEKKKKREKSILKYKVAMRKIWILEEKKKKNPVKPSYT